jgi:hypothetical protein
LAAAVAAARVAASGATPGNPDAAVTPADAAAAARRGGTMVDNPEFATVDQPLFGHLFALNLQTRDVKRYNSQRTPPVAMPVDSNGTAFCLTYHVKGRCNTGCGYAVDHVAHTALQNQLLSTWCTANYRIRD